VLKTENRDLASGELWADSLIRSRRRRRWAVHARKEQNRRKTASLAVSAAVVAAPMWPNVAASGSLEGKANAAEGLKPHKGRERVLLSRGDTSPTVASLQHKLGISEDGIFGPQTEAAVRAFQKRTRLPVTGDVDVQTWLTLFPNDAIVAASSTASSGEPQWAAVSTQPADTSPAATVPASVSVATDSGPLTDASGRKAAQRPGAKAAKAKAADLLHAPADSPPDGPTSGDPEPPAEGPADGVLAPPSGGKAPSGGQAPSGQTPSGDQAPAGGQTDPNREGESQIPPPRSHRPTLSTICTRMRSGRYFPVALNRVALPVRLWRRQQGRRR